MAGSERMRMGFGWFSGVFGLGEAWGWQRRGSALPGATCPLPGWPYLPPSTHHLPKVPIAGVLGLTNPPKPPLWGGMWRSPSLLPLPMG